MLNAKRNLLSAAVASVIASVTLPSLSYGQWVFPDENGQPPAISGTITTSTQGENQFAIAGAVDIYTPADASFKPADFGPTFPFNISKGAVLRGDETGDLGAGLAILSRFSGDLINEGTIEGQYGIRSFAEQDGGITNDGTIRGSVYAVSFQAPVGNVPNAIPGFVGDMTLFPFSNNGLISAATLDEGKPANDQVGYAFFEQTLSNIVTIENSGRIFGKLKGKFDINNDENGTVTVWQGEAGDAISSYSGAKGSKLNAYINADTDSERGILVVSGKASFESGSDIYLSSRNVFSSLAEGDKTYLVIDAGTLVIEKDEEGKVPVKLNDVLEQVFTTDVTYDEGNNKLLVALTKKADAVIPEPEPEPGPGPEPESGPPQRILDLFADAGLNTQQTTALVKLLANDKTIASDPVAQLLRDAFSSGGLSKGSELAELLFDADNNDVSLAGIRSGLSAVQQVIDARNASQGVNSGDQPIIRGFWLEVLHDKSRQNSRKDINGYRSKTTGFSLGMDRELNDEITAGIAFSHAISDIASKTSDADTRSKSYIASLYGTRQMGEYFLEGSLSYGQADNASKRLNKLIRSSYDSRLHNARMILGRDLLFGEQNILVQPVIGVNYTRIKIDGYSEKGSSLGLTKTFKAVSTDSFELGLGVRANASFDLDDGVLVPSIKAMYWRDTQDERIKSDTRLNLPGLTGVNSVSYASPEKNTLQIGVGVKYLIGNNFTLSANYDRTHKKGFNADTYTARLRYDF